MSDNKKYISVINVNEAIYHIKDTEAREDVSNMKMDMSSKLDKNVNTEVSGVFNFTNGVQVGDAAISYDAANQTVTFM